MKRLILICFAVLGLVGCVTDKVDQLITPHGARYYSTNDVPLALRGSPTQAVILIKQSDPQPDPQTHIILGEVRSSVGNLTVFERRGEGALNLLKDEAMQMGADAIINVRIAQTQFGSSARGLAIRFKK